jgi:hypothetical protein
MGRAVPADLRPSTACSLSTRPGRISRRRAWHPARASRTPRRDERPASLTGRRIQRERPTSIRGNATPAPKTTRPRAGYLHDKDGEPALIVVVPRRQGVPPANHLVSYTAHGSHLCGCFGGRAGWHATPRHPQYAALGKADASSDRVRAPGGVRRQPPTARCAAARGPWRPEMHPTLRGTRNVPVPARVMLLFQVKARLARRRPPRSLLPARYQLRQRRGLQRGPV